LWIRSADYIGLRYKDGICDHDHLDIAKRLIKHWRPKEALKWLDNMEIPINHHWQQDRKDLTIQALELDGNYEQAQKERLCKRSGNPIFYQKNKLS
jgi:hypothetical protein